MSHESGHGLMASPNRALSRPSPKYGAFNTSVNKQAGICNYFMQDWDLTRTKIADKHTAFEHTLPSIFYLPPALYIPFDNFQE
jgi:hypothetical protein